MGKYITTALMVTGLAVSAACHASNEYVLGGSINHPGNVATLNATAITLTDSGWYTSIGENQPTNTNYIISTDYYGRAFNDFFVIDLSGVSGPITSATLTVNAFFANSSQLVTFYDYTGSVSSLLDGTGGVAAFNDLGSGAVYGQLALSPSDNYTYVSVTLSSAALTDINAAISNNQSTFVIGGSIAAVPEPENYALMLVGLSAVGLAARRRRKN
jgi:hypothetical protein